jgi:rhodanese-related sulfurtransferase
MALTTLRTIPLDEALNASKGHAALVDLRDVMGYLDVHIPGSLALVYEFGPGMAGRARDCIPLSIPLILLESTNANMLHAAASLRGKGFEVLGMVPDAVNLYGRSNQRLASTEVAQGSQAPSGTIVDVADPGRVAHEGARNIPLDGLWGQREELSGESTVTVLSGRGVRAALAVGMLERAGISEVRLWRKLT